MPMSYLWDQDWLAEIPRILEERKRAEEERKERERKQREEAQRKRELAELERLQQKYKEG